MSTKIYWGRPGSYKTSSAVKTDLVEFAFEGRVVVTNIRGLNNEDRIRRVLEKQFKKKVPDTFKIIHQESDSEEGRYKWQRYFHWAPIGCAFLVDEVQDVWRKSWTSKYLDTLNYSGGPDKALEDGRPYDFLISFEKHRHYNWDFVVTTPHIKKVRDDIREIADFAYKHRNMALVGISSKFSQFGHDPDNNCRTDADVEQEKPMQVIPAWVFDLYESTATGDITDTRNGYKFWKQPKIMILLSVALLCWVWVGFHLGDIKKRFIPSDDVIEGESVSSVATAGKGKSVIRSEKSKYFSDLSKLDIYYSGKYIDETGVNYLFTLKEGNEKDGILVDAFYFRSMGFGLIEINNNMILAVNGSEKYYFKAKGQVDDKKIF